MARFFPHQSSRKLSAEQAKAFNALRRVSGDALKVWMPIPAFERKDQPHFLLMHARGGAAVWMVSGLSEAEAELALQENLFQSEKGLRPEEVGEAEGRLALAFLELFKQQGGEASLVAPTVVFPNVPQALLDQIARLAMPRVVWLGKEALRGDALTQRWAQPCPQTLSPDAVDALRSLYSPEIGIPARLVVSPRQASRKVGARLDRYLLDLHQEWLAKEDLDNEVATAAAAAETRIRLVTGVAGSGKTLVLLYRALFQVRAHPDRRLLILTHNRPLRGELEARCETLMPGQARVGCHTFLHWCQRLSGRYWKEIIPSWQRDALLLELIGESKALAAFPPAFLDKEIDWIRDQGIASRAEYLSAARTGRKRGLNEEQRRAVFDLLLRYQKVLIDRKLNDWSGAAYSLERMAEQGDVHVPRYDQIFIDEAQFFAPVWFRLIRRCLVAEQGRLFLAADPTQGFLQRRQSWLGIGLDVRGQSVRLLRSYRNTRRILQAAAAFYRARLPEEEEEINLPEPGQLHSLPEGERPRLLWMDSSQGVQQRVVNEILAAIEQGARPEHFLVLLADRSQPSDMVQALNGGAGRELAVNLKDLRPRQGKGCVKVSTLNAATGLESPVVFLCGVEWLLEQEDGLTLAEDERGELFRDNTRRLYMGMTRAGQRLIVPVQRERTVQWLESIGFQLE